MTSTHFARRGLFISAALSIGLAITSTAASAQTMLSGVVRDTNDLGVPGVTVVISVEGTAKITTSDFQGRYKFEGLPVGTANVVFLLSGFQTVGRGIKLTSSPGTLDAKLSLGLSRDYGEVGVDDVTSEEYSFTVPRAFRWIWNSSWNEDGLNSLP